MWYGFLTVIGQVNASLQPC